MKPLASKKISDGAPPSKEMAAHHYPLMYEVEETHWWYVGRRKIIQTFLERICSRLDNATPRILDVGCGTGANLKMLRLFGRAEGIDISEQAIELCKQRGLESVKVGAIEDLDYDDQSFDIITALDVLEHLDDDASALQEMRRVLRDGGRLVLFVPTFMFLWGVQDDVSHHRRRYRLPALRRLLEENGFEIEKATYANISFFVPALLVRTFMRWFRIRTATEYGINVSQMNTLFSKVFAAERFLLTRGRFPFGVSALCIARRVDRSTGVPPVLISDPS